MKMVTSGITRKFSRQILIAQKHSPRVLFAAGTIGVVASTVLACRATLKLEEILAETEDNLNTARTLQHDKYSDDDRKKDVAYVYARSVVKIGKLYGPSVVLGAASISALCGSHHILTKRNAALTAAYAAVQKSFDEYRQRVIDELGEDRERELRYSVEEKTEKSKDGTKKVVKEVTGRPSMYARFFDEHNRNWSPTPEYNLLFIRCQQTYLNDLLRSRGHVFLNDVYDHLGIDRSKEGAVVGWLWDADSGDNYIDFGIFDGPACETVYEFAVGREGIWLDFNVDGVIYDKI